MRRAPVSILGCLAVVLYPGAGRAVAAPERESGAQHLAQRVRDSATGPPLNLLILRVERADAVEVAEILQTLLGDAPRRRHTVAIPNRRLVLVSVSPERFVLVFRILAEIDRPRPNG